MLSKACLLREVLVLLLGETSNLTGYQLGESMVGSCLSRLTMGSLCQLLRPGTGFTSAAKLHKSTQTGQDGASWKPIWSSFPLPSPMALARASFSAGCTGPTQGFMRKVLKGLPSTQSDVTDLQGGGCRCSEATYTLHSGNRETEAQRDL